MDFSSGADRFLAELQDWVYACGCFAHSGLKTLKWGLKGLEVGGAEMLESIHSSVSALLRGSQGLFVVVPEFIATYVVLDLPEADNMSDLQWFWTYLEGMTRQPAL